MRLKPEEISRVIREQIKNYEAKVSEADTGTVLIVGDGIARVSGLDRCVAGELLHFATGGYGMAMNLEENSVAVALLGEDRDVAEGTRVERTWCTCDAHVCVGSMRHAMGCCESDLANKAAAQRR